MDRGRGVVWVDWGMGYREVGGDGDVKGLGMVEGVREGVKKEDKEGMYDMNNLVYGEKCIWDWLCDFVKEECVGWGM